MIFYNENDKMFVNTIYESLSIETKIGTWINNKPIYRKVFDNCNFGGGSGIWANTGKTIENVETLVNAHAIRTTDKAVVNHFSFRMNNNDIQYYTNTAFTGCDILVVEYTKTTD